MMRMLSYFPIMKTAYEECRGPVSRCESSGLSPRGWTINYFGQSGEGKVHSRENSEELLQ